MADAASSGLRDFDADLSAASGASRAQIAVCVAAISAAFAALCLSSTLWFALAQVLTVFMAVGVMVRLLASLNAGLRTIPHAPPLHDAALPTYSLIIALYREAEVAAKLLAAVERTDYPRAKLDVKVVIEEDDEETRQAFAALVLPPWWEIIVAPHGAPRTKPRALNVALPFARGELVTVYDAEDEPESDQLRLAAARFAQTPSGVACLQASLAIDNSADSWLTALFAIEYAALFDVVNPGLTQLNLPMPLGGTSNHFRVSVLRDLRGWDAWNVTEDADLGLRLARSGYRVEALASTTHEEAPATVRAWLGQRRRWQKGWMQTLITLSRDPRRLVRELGFIRAVTATLFLLAGVLGPLFGPVLIAISLYDAFAGNLLSPGSWLAILASALWCLSLLACLVSILLPAALGIRRRSLRREAKFLPLAFAYYVLMSWAAWHGLVELVFNPFHWSKTRHGMARSSRRRPVRTLESRRAGMIRGANPVGPFPLRAKSL